MLKKVLVAIIALGTFSLSAQAAPVKKPAGASAAKPAEAKPKVPPPPDYFPLRVNDWWKYQSTTGEGKQTNFMMKVVSSEKLDDVDETVIYKVDTTSTVAIHDWYSKHNGHVLRRKEQFGENESALVNYDPFLIYLNNPLNKGDTWQWNGKGLMGVAIQESSEVSGPEDIYVPAGKFSTMKVTTKVIQGGSPVTKTYWFANWVGLIKSATQSGPVGSVTELLDYSFKKPEKKD